MWLFTKDGFYSIAQANRNDPLIPSYMAALVKPQQEQESETVQAPIPIMVIRCRLRTHLMTALQQMSIPEYHQYPKTEHEPRKRELNIIECPECDYRWRAFVHFDVFQNWFNDIACGILYENFKNEILSDTKYHDAVFDVWVRMRDLQTGGIRVEHRDDAWSARQDLQS